MNMQPLDLVSFDAVEFELQGHDDGVLHWKAPSGDMVGLYYFDLPPDIVADLSSITSVRNFYRQIVTNAGAAIIEVETPEIAGCLTTRLIIKVPQNPGMTYVGSITLPFRDFSYVLKAQCEEHGVTGMRDAIVFNEKMSSGEITMGSEKDIRPGWMCDPYDSSLKDGFAMNLSEDKQYDARFPHHPLSRLRRLLDHFQGTLRVLDEVKRKPRL
jgi:hypothetical protein